MSLEKPWRRGKEETSDGWEESDDKDERESRHISEDIEKNQLEEDPEEKFEVCDIIEWTLRDV